MYVPGHFAEQSPERLARFVDEHPLATLVGVVDGRLDAQHLPFLRLDPLEPGATLVAHCARGNPVWKLGEARAEVLLVFAGAAAYVSPSFYPSKAQDQRVVPTYNYAAVHVRGELRCAHDAATKRRVVELLTDRMEASRVEPWSMADAPADYIDRMLNGIVALSLEVRTIEAKFKASQNRSVVDREGVVEALRTASAAGAEAAELVARTIVQP